MLNNKNHIEVRLIEDKEPPPPKSNGGIVITITVTATLALTFTLTFKPEIIFPDRREPPPEIPWPIPLNVESPLPPEEHPFIVGEHLLAPKPGLAVRINQCNGSDYAGANFRGFLSLTPLSIRGVVPQGDWVVLTGITARTHDIFWYEAINQSALSRSNEPYAKEQKMDSNQKGWIAACFVR